MTHDEAVQFFSAQQEDWKVRDPESLSRHYAEEGVIVSPIFKIVRGRQEILRSYRSLFAMFPDWTYVQEQLVADGNRVAQQFVVQATHVNEFMGLPGSGRRFEIQGVRFMEVQDGLIASEKRVYDFTALLLQLGVLRGKSVRP